MAKRVIDPDERYTRRFNALDATMFDVERFELFTEGLNEFFFSAQQLTENKGLVAENYADTPLIPLAESVDEAARDMIRGVVNFYGRQIAYNATAALMNVNEEMRKMEKGRRIGKKGRKR
jgi:hypothetical protein